MQVPRIRIRVCTDKRAETCLSFAKFLDRVVELFTHASNL